MSRIGATKMSDVESFMDSENFGGGDKDAFKTVIITQLARITAAGSKEMIGGFWQQKVKKSEQGVLITEKIWVPDARSEYINSILTLDDLLIVYQDDTAKQELKAFEKRLHELKQRLAAHNSETQKNTLAQYYRKMFRILLRLLERKDFLAEGVYTDEI